ncbi:sensor histidine kinase [Streptomyces sp. NPDC049879]|uniref:sensor histidine kinase n=1 Tax=Streptomyces sp. NPDC049879 TaxID=3365598 RepID=UPI003790B502
MSATEAPAVPDGSAGADGTDGTGVPAFAVRAALARPPVRFLLSSWPLRCWAHLAGGALLGAAALLTLVVLAFTGGVLAVVGVGLLLLACTALLGIPVAAMERRRLRLVEPTALTSPHRPPPRAGAWRRLRHRWTERATWREFDYLILLGVVFAAAGLAVLALLTLSCAYVVSPLIVWALAPETVMLIPGHAVPGPPAAVPFSVAGVAGLVLSAYAAGWLTLAQVRTAWFLLSPREDRMRERAIELTRSRARLADAFAAERRRIERDLHDGAQQQLVALTMTLGLAEVELRGSDPKAAALVARGREEARRALEQLRDLVRGIHPQVLTDHGLAAAVAEVALRTPVPVAVDIRLPCRLPAPVETTAYFAVLEGLANAARHSGASHVGVTGRFEGGSLVLLVEDDGRGGVDPARGTGLSGLADRLAVLDGRLVVESPAGGPTRLRMEVPCSA